MSLNKWVGMGRLTREPELKYSNNGGAEALAVLKFTVAVDRKKKDETDFIQCVAFGKKAEHISKYYHKGSMIVVEGRLQTGKYTRQDGTEVPTTEILVEDTNFGESKKDGSQKAQESPQPQQNYNPPTQYQAQPQDNVQYQQPQGQQYAAQPNAQQVQAQPQGNGQYQQYQPQQAPAQQYQQMAPQATQVQGQQYQPQVSQQYPPQAEMQYGTPMYAPKQPEVNPNEEGFL